MSGGPGSGGNRGGASGGGGGKQGGGGETGMITTIQFVWMLVSIIASFSGAYVPTLLIQTARGDGWMSIVVAWVMDLLLAVVYAYMGLRFPKQTFVEYATSALGPWLGKPVGFMFPTFFFFMNCLLLESLSYRITSLFLPGTPPEVVTISAVLVVAYGARAGLEAVARAAAVLAPTFAVGIGFGLLLVSPKFKLDLLGPPLEMGFAPVLTAVPLVLSFLAVCIMMGVFQAYQDRPRHAWLAKFSGLSIGALMLTGVVIAAVALLGPSGAGASLYPDLAVARLITVGDFLERVEVGWMIISVGSGVLSLAVLLWATALGIAQTFGLKDYKSLVMPLAGLMAPLSLLLFASQSEAMVFVHSTFPVYALSVEAGLEILIWLGALIRGRRGKQAQARMPDESAR